MMRFGLCLLFLLYAFIPNSFSDSSEDLIPCEGGYCMPRFMCPNGTYQEFKLQDSNLITLRFVEDEECFDNMGVCCGNNTTVGVNPTCPGGYCVSKELCPQGKYDETQAQNIGLVGLKIGQDCQDPEQICCSASPAPIGRKLTDDQVKCGMSNPGYGFEKPNSIHAYAKYLEFPWMVIIMEYASGSESTPMVGGGSLIHPQFVLSAAHIFKERVESWIARFGEYDLNSRRTEAFPTQDVRILPNVIIHPEYDHTSLGNDIALAKLEQKITYQENVLPICLPEPNEDFSGQRCISTGWGEDVTTNKYPNIMKRIELPVITRKTCKRLFRATRLSPFFQLHKSVLCAGGEPGADACYGDGGGPLACQKPDGSYVLAGIVSWGLGCNVPDVPGAYVNVAKFTEWISQTLSVEES